MSFYLQVDDDDRRLVPDAGRSMVEVAWHLNEWLAICFQVNAILFAPT
ncbi:hypothetical protein SAMN05192563_100596 [Paraburkholderia aspalathi]|uniref:Uncharacterized protein n=1 Tax=Paraburkholderia aspalathi TaxID=1324617 RepID=A0A1I7BT30_9BURK|nr:hypothetical protein SAMN05192563_100596 [Paraburkholderia aspalathi]